MGDYITARMNEGRKKKVVFEVQQEENLLYGLIGMGMAGLSEEWLGERD